MSGLIQSPGEKSRAENPPSCERSTMRPHYIPQDRFPMELTPRITVLGNYFFNLFLVRGDKKSALFETGVSGCVDRVIAQMDSIGVEPDYLIVSHPHSDHITGLDGLAARFPKAVILAGAGAVEFVTHPKAGALLIKEDDFISKSLEREGAPPGRPPLDLVPDIFSATIIDRETSLDLGGQTTLDLIPVQGHSPGNLLAWVEADQAMFCSDSLGFHYPGRGFWPLFFTGAKAYIETIHKIGSFSPRILCPAHQGPITGDAAASAVDEALKATASLLDKIRENQLPDQELIRELFKESYRDEFTLYTPDNIENCSRLLVKRAREITHGDQHDS